MICYLDSSVILRVVFGEPGRLKEWRRIERGVTSSLCRAECLRTIDRARLRLSLSDEEVSRRRQAFFAVYDRLDAVRLTEAVLERAAQPLPTSLDTLDAIHLASAVLWCESTASRLTLATHDESLATAARAVGLEVVGAPG
jgi:predicted nucleic acid-binding protein